MKFFFAYFFLLLSVGAMAQHDFMVYAIGCPDGQTPAAYTFDGFKYSKLLDPVRQDGDKYYFQIPAEHTYLFFGTNATETKGVLVTNEKEAYLVTNCGRFSAARAIKSPVNENLEQSLQELYTIQSDHEEKVAAYYEQDNKKEKKNLAKEIEHFTQKKQQKIDSLQALSSVFKQLGGVYFTELDLEAASYDAAFKKGADKKFKTLASAQNIPLLYDYFQKFAEQVANQKWSEKEKFQFLDANIGKLSRNNQAFAYNGAINYLLRHEVILGMQLGKSFIQKFESTYPNELKELQGAISRLESQTIGAEAPNLVGTAPDGSTVSLKDLRGKYVLLDFWASWCGPCRRENPNVVRVYQEYKDQGFDILGVSLDNKKENWVNAIEKDGLTWGHISDLKGWASEHAKQYGVRSVPHTVLIDPKGRIIATRLRAHSLEEKLKELFGS